jgi:hypothetical protein
VSGGQGTGSARLSAERKPEGWQTPLVRMVERGKTGAVRTLMEYADITARDPDGRPLVQLARDQGFGETVTLLRDVSFR